MLADQAVQITTSAQRLTGQVVMMSIQQFLMSRQFGQFHGSAGPVQGEQSLKDLNAQGKPLERYEMHEKDLKYIRQELKRYEVDFHIMKDPEEDIYHLFFKAQDVDRVTLGLNKCAEQFQDAADRRPMAEQMASAAKEAAERSAQRAAEPAVEQAVKSAAEAAL